MVRCRNRNELNKYTDAVKNLLFQLCRSSFGSEREVLYLFSKCPNIFYDIAIDIFMSLRWEKLDEGEKLDEQIKYIRLNRKENLRIKRDEILSQHYGITKEKIECELNDYISKKEDKIRNAFSDNRRHESIRKLEEQGDIKRETYMKAGKEICKEVQVIDIAPNVIRMIVSNTKFRNLFLGGNKRYRYEKGLEIFEKDYPNKDNADNQNIGDDKDTKCIRDVCNTFTDDFYWEDKWCLEKMVGFNITYAIYCFMKEYQHFSSYIDDVTSTVVQCCASMNGTYSKILVIDECRKNLSTWNRELWKNRDSVKKQVKFFNDKYEKLREMFAFCWYKIWDSDINKMMRMLDIFCRMEVYRHGWEVELQKYNMFVISPLDIDENQVKQVDNQMFAEIWEKVINELNVFGK